MWHIFQILPLYPREGAKLMFYPTPPPWFLNTPLKAMIDHLTLSFSQFPCRSLLLISIPIFYFLGVLSYLSFSIFLLTLIVFGRGGDVSNIHATQKIVKSVISHNNAASIEQLSLFKPRKGKKKHLRDLFYPPSAPRPPSEFQKTWKLLRGDPKDACTMSMH